MSARKAIAIEDHRLVDAAGLRLRLVLECPEEMAALAARWAQPFLAPASVQSGSTDLCVITVSHCGQDDGSDLGSVARSWTWSPDERVLEVTLSGGALPQRADVAMGFVRLLLKSAAVRVGGWNWHAGAIAREERVALISADRGSGKTTSLLASLQSAPFQFVANDQVLALACANRVNVLGFPALTRVRQGGVVSLNPGSVLWTERDTLDGGGLRNVVAPQDLAGSLGRAVASSGVLAAVVLYHKSDDPDHLDVAKTIRSIDLIEPLLRLPLSDAYGSVMAALGREVVDSHVTPLRDIRCMASVSVIDATVGLRRASEFAQGLYAELE